MYVTNVRPVVVVVRPQGRPGQLLDQLMQPIMYWLQGNYSELPQRTHRWNNQKLTPYEVTKLDPSGFATIAGSRQAAAPWWLGIFPRFHMPRFGGWNEYVVLQPQAKQTVWFVGWHTTQVSGFSRVSLTDQVRVLRGQTAASFFGLDRSGRQVALKQVGLGTIGVGGVSVYGVPMQYGNLWLL